MASVLPPENTTSNLVTIVKTVPVWIKLDPDQEAMDRLRPGMSVESMFALSDPGDPICDESMPPDSATEELPW